MDAITALARLPFLIPLAAFNPIRPTARLTNPEIFTEYNRQCGNIITWENIIRSQTAYTHRHICDNLDNLMDETVLRSRSDLVTIIDVLEKRMPDESERTCEILRKRIHRIDFYRYRYY